MRYKSAVIESNSRTGCSHGPSGTATKSLPAPTSTPATFRFTWDSSAVRLSRLTEALTADLTLLLRVLLVASIVGV